MYRLTISLAWCVSALFLGACSLDFDQFADQNPQFDVGVPLEDVGVDDMEAPDVDPIDMMAPDAAPIDSDGDDIVDDQDNCPMVSNADQADQDMDGQGDVCDEDVDGDGIADDEDNCRLVANEGQLDLDGDGEGDACDADVDGDGLDADAEQMKGTNPNLRDSDFDGFDDQTDLCPLQADEYNHDTDGDLQGDICDQDDDGDGVVDWWDNCHLVANPDGQAEGDLGVDCQADYDADGIENAIDSCPFDWGPSNDEQACASRFDVWTYGLQIQALDRSAGGSLAIATAGGLFRMTGQGFERRGYPNPLDSMDVKALDAGQNDLFMLTGTGLSILDAVYPRATNIRSGSIPERPTGQFRDVAGSGDRIWIASDEGLNVFRDGEWALVGEDVLGTIDVRGVYKDGLDRVWVMTGAGVVRMVADAVDITFDALPDVGPFHRARPGYEGRTWLLGERGAVLIGVGDLVEATLSGLSPKDIGSGQESYLATDQGLVRVDTESRPFPAAYRPLPTSTVSAVLGEYDDQNNEDSFLIGTSAGLHEIGGVFATYDAAAVGDCVTTSARIGGLLWVGTSQGLKIVRRDGTLIEVGGDSLPGFDAMTNPQPGVNVIKQVGVEVWVGTNAGIAVFDEAGTPTDQLVEQLRGPGQENAVIAVTSIQPAIGEIWVGTSGAGLKRRDSQGTWFHRSVQNTQNRLVSDTINALAYDGTTLWVATPAGLTVYRNGAFLQPVLPVPGGRLPTLQVDDVAVGAGYVFVATSEGVAVGGADNLWTTLRRDRGGIPAEAGTNHALSVTYFGGSLWIALKDSRQQPRGSLLRRSPNPGAPDDGVLYPSLTVGLPDSEAVGGVQLDQPAKELFVNVCGADESPGGLSVLGSGEMVTDSYVGERAAHSLRGRGEGATLTGGPGAGPMVVGLQDGNPIADRLVGGAVIPQPLPDEFSSPPISCGTPQVAGDTLWCAFDGEGFAKLNQNGRWSATRAAGLPVIEGVSLRQIVVVDDRAWWMATDGGVIRFMGGSLQALNSAFTDGGLPSDDVRALLLHGTTLYAATAAGVGILDLDTNEWSQLGRESLPNISARALAVDGDGALWVGTDGGVFKRTLPEGDSADYTVQSGLWDNRVHSLAIGVDGTVHIATNGGLNSRLGDGTFVRSTTHHGLPGNGVYELFVQDEAVWARSDWGVSRVR